MVEPRMEPAKETLSAHISDSGVTLQISFSSYSGESETGLKQDPESFWHSAGRQVENQGYRVPDGMIYVGSDLGAAKDWQHILEPSLVDPALYVASSIPNRTGEGIGYWPAYKSLTPSSRAAYLEWLADGRKNPATYLGYVFLFFYGLERRLLHDLSEKTDEVAQLERGLLIREIERLDSIYGKRGSFGGYARNLLEAVQAIQSKRPMYESAPPIAEGSLDSNVTLRVALGQLAVAGKPIPPEWALAWVVAHPETRIRTPFRRVTEEFVELFTLRYREMFGEGFRFEEKQLAKRRLQFSYHPASPGFMGNFSMDLGDLPDVASLGVPLGRLRRLFEQCQEDLEAFSRLVAKDPTARGGLPALATLPTDLALTRQSGEIGGLRKWLDGVLVEEKVGVISTDDLFAWWPVGADGKFTKREAVCLAQALERLGFGVEPDVRFGAPVPEKGEKALVFRISKSAPSAPSQAYTAALLLLRLAAIVAAADKAITPQEEEHLAEHLEEALRLERPERSRLRMHLRWLLIAPPSLSGLKRLLAPLSREQKNSLGRFLVGVACVDGRVDPGEVKILTRIFGLLDLVESDVYKQIHAVTTGSAVPASEEPVIIASAEDRPPGFAIPGPPGKVARESLVLDMGRVEAKIAESAAAAALLAGIFAQSEPTSPASGNSFIATATPTRAGRLDSVHAALLHSFRERGNISRSEFERAAADRGLLPDAAIEMINDTAFEAAECAVLDGDDPIEIDWILAKEMIA